MKILIQLALVFFLLLSCNKIDIARIVKIQTVGVYVGESTVIIKSSIIDIGNNETLKYGHCWATRHMPTIDDDIFYSGQTDQLIEYSDTLNGLVSGITYYIRPFAFDGINYYYGDEKIFNAGITGLKVFAEEAILIGNYSVRLSGSYSGNGSYQVTNAGINWSDDIAFLNNTNTIDIGNEMTNFSTDIINLEKQKTYYFRSFVNIAGSDTQYSVTKSFQLPTLALTTDTAVVDGSSSISFIGNILSLSVFPADDHGFCWSTTTSHPTYNDSKVSLGQANQTGVFVHQATGLAGGRTYYYRAWAKEEGHFVYGAIKSVYLP